MKTITLTITLEVPDGMPVSVGSGAAGSGSVAPALSQAPTLPQDAVPWPEPPPDMSAAADAVFGDLVKNPENVLHDTPHVVSAPTPPPGGHHGQPWKFVPAGVSKSTGKPYSSFYACQERGCKARP